MLAIRDNLEALSRVKYPAHLMTHRVQTNLGWRTLKVDSNTGLGVLDIAASTAFTWGFCHCFAGAMNDRIGWKIVGIGGYENDPAHFVTYSPELKSYVDIDGPDAMDRYPDFQFRIREWEREELVTFLTNYRPLNVELAKPFVESVLKDINTRNGLTLGETYGTMRVQ